MKTEIKTHLEYLLNPPPEDQDPLYSDDQIQLVIDLFNRTGDLSKDMTHAVTGVITEAYEMETAKDETNALEEIGDGIFFWHAMMLVSVGMAEEGVIAEGEIARAYDWVKSLEEEFQVAYRSGTHAGKVNRRHVHECLDIVKKWVGYGKEPTETTSELLGKTTSILFYGIEQACSKLHRTDTQEVLREAIQMNLAKLRVRYKDGKFSQDSAINRDKGAEREALESSAK